MKQEIKRGCTLNDAELLERVHDWVSRLCISGGNEWVLSVPVDFNHDPDYLISELCNRYAAKQEEYASKGMPDKENEPVELQERAKEYAERVCNGSFPIEYTREQVVKHTANDFIAGFNFRQPEIESLQNQSKVLSAIKNGLEKSLSESLSRIKELEADNEILKMENSHSKLVVDEAKREIDRLKWLKGLD